MSSSSEHLDWTNPPVNDAFNHLYNFCSLFVTRLISALSLHFPQCLEYHPMPIYTDDEYKQKQWYYQLLLCYVRCIHHAQLPTCNLGVLSMCRILCLPRKKSLTVKRISDQSWLSWTYYSILERHCVSFTIAHSLNPHSTCSLFSRPFTRLSTGASHTGEYTRVIYLPPDLPSLSLILLPLS